MISDTADNTIRLDVHNLSKISPITEGVRLIFGGPVELKGQITGGCVTLFDLNSEKEWSISLLTTPCNFGGVRYWWECSACQRRVGILYYLLEIWSCRQCHFLRYESQYEGDGKLNKANRIRKRLRLTDGPIKGLEDKPKGMALAHLF